MKPVRCFDSTRRWKIFLIEVKALESFVDCCVLFIMRRKMRLKYESFTKAKDYVAYTNAAIALGIGGKV